MQRTTEVAVAGQPVRRTAVVVRSRDYALQEPTRAFDLVGAVVALMGVDPGIVLTTPSRYAALTASTRVPTPSLAKTACK